ncbi:CpsB/CapC family capsule biosynthesis tyrosine phosphatase [Conexibacter sp. CPCC 206217]|uniref:CpsB/CapC family capsule biosynthesis tyrosine phosphatase n=1 Tax=Conexibacter sp. CPCC 206217 TaxID=3064574 RepID=UPI002715F4AC|nr:CpsB/CapC family capsule biosynthesis tyrosine phosphatase [Conexibacter sp. CPCC 206217]MDO8211809.1 CpsB/CapC family capsule biosynthesis tyrosine phosphatase [Conexibacter sp. CPCC 206217]
MQRGFVDLHVHLLPGVDDGPRDLDATLELAGLEVADGIVTATATPHVASLDVAEIPARVAEVNAALRDAGIPLTVEGGGELAARGAARLSADELELIAHGPAGARWILLEAPLDGSIAILHSAADTLRDAGYGVVLAHPERCHPLFEREMQGLRRELELGSLAQVSSSSLLGLHGIRARRNAVRLLAGGHAGLMASDAHGRRRPPSMTAALAAACELGLDPLEARALCAERPRALLIEGLCPCGQASDGAAPANGAAPDAGGGYVAGRDVSVVRRVAPGAAAPSLTSR